MKSLYRLLLGIMFAAGIASAGTLFDPPEDWVEVELPNPSPGDIVAIQGYSSPDGIVHIVLTQFDKVFQTKADAEDMMRGQLKALEKSGFQHKETAATNFKGFEAMVQRGKQPQGDAGITLDLESYAVFSDTSILSITILNDTDSAGGDGAIALLDRIKIPGSPIKFTAGLGRIPGDTVAERSGYLVGTIMGYVFIATLVVFGIRALVRNARRDRERLIQAVPQPAAHMPKSADDDPNSRPA